MEWLIYNKSDENTQIFIGVLLLSAIMFVALANLYFWIKDKIKKS